MPVKSIYTNLSLAQRREILAQRLHQCRAATLELFAGMDSVTFCAQAHPDFSPVGWHLGHIAYTEAKWLLERCRGDRPLFPQYQQLFAADGLPKHARVQLPTLTETHDYLEAVRSEVLAYLETASLDPEERLWRWIIQHESQHSETITLVLLLQGKYPSHPLPEMPRGSNQIPDLAEMRQIPAGYFDQGNDSLDALDNESPAHSVYLETYWIDRYPVTCGQYRVFMESGGYRDRRWWSEAGWQWLQSQSTEIPLTQPLYWLDIPTREDHPVCGVSWYEAEAYANFVGKRLPTEAEWEKAACWDSSTLQSHPYPWGAAEPDAHRCNHNHAVGQTTPVQAYPEGQSPSGCYDMLGNVWEWTADWFDGYEGFTSYPYRGYSQAYFDQQHRVLKGGSWATRPGSLRGAFRNWYHPVVRQILAGFRCVRHLV